MKMIQNTRRLLTAAWRSGLRFTRGFDAGFAVTLLMTLAPLAVTAGATDEAKSSSKPSATEAPAVPAGASLKSSASRSDLVPTDKSSYLIRSGDMVEIRVYQEDDLNTKTRVDEEGTLVLPLIGRVPVRGLTTESARKAISDRYEADYLNHPQVTVLVAEFAPRRFVMMGQVSRPGVYEIPSSERLNLLQAIAMAGGYTKIADPTKVRIRRSSEKGEEILRFNAKALATGGGGEVPLIAPEDNITVGESAF
jgi:polysaccharide export outer membrane protein